MNAPEIFTVPLKSLSLKRVAWAYGCAKKGSDDERKLLALLLERARQAFERSAA